VQKTASKTLEKCPDKILIKSFNIPSGYLT
jgi:hypothetical protein